MRRNFGKTKVVSTISAVDYPEYFDMTHNKKFDFRKLLNLRALFPYLHHIINVTELVLWCCTGELARLILLSIMMWIRI